METECAQKDLGCGNLALINGLCRSCFENKDRNIKPDEGFLPCKMSGCKKQCDLRFGNYCEPCWRIVNFENKLKTKKSFDVKHVGNADTKPIYVSKEPKQFDLKDVRYEYFEDYLSLEIGNNDNEDNKIQIGDHSTKSYPSNLPATFSPVSSTIQIESNQPKNQIIESTQQQQIQYLSKPLPPLPLLQDQVVPFREQNQLLHEQIQLYEDNILYNKDTTHSFEDLIPAFEDKIPHFKDIIEPLQDQTQPLREKIQPLVEQDDLTVPVIIKKPAKCIHCTNFTNPKKQGYCNSCFDKLSLLATPFNESKITGPDVRKKGIIKTGPDITKRCIIAGCMNQLYDDDIICKNCKKNNVEPRNNVTVDKLVTNHVTSKKQCIITGCFDEVFNNNIICGGCQTTDVGQLKDEAVVVNNCVEKGCLNKGSVVMNGFCKQCFVECVKLQIMEEQENTKKADINVSQMPKKKLAVQQFCQTIGCENFVVPLTEFCEKCYREQPSAQCKKTGCELVARLELGGYCFGCFAASTIPKNLTIEDKKEETKKLCKTVGCNNVVFPSLTLCEQCFEAQPADQPCKAVNCEMFGSPEFGGYCSQCFVNSTRPKNEIRPEDERFLGIPNLKYDDLPAHDSICTEFQINKCLNGPTCPFIHLTRSFSWIFFGTNYWEHFKEYQKIENAYCDPYQEKVMLNDGREVDLNEQTATKKDSLVVTYIRRISTKSEAKKRKSPGATKWTWYWRNETYEWKEYYNGKEPLSFKIECSFINGDATYVVKSRQHTYNLNFAKMTQQDVNLQYHTKTPICRRPFCVEKRFKKPVAKEIHPFMSARLPMPQNRHFNRRSYKTLRNLFDDDDEKMEVDDIQLNGEQSVYPTHWPANVPKKGYIKIAARQQDFNETAAKLQAEINNINIISIEEICNKQIYDKYKLKCGHMLLNSNALNEMQLWHGTTVNVVDSICQNSFDWRYCGKNGVAFGNGVYFAKHAATSHGFSVKGGNNEKHMFLANVLVGDYTQGSNGLKVPPKRSGNESFDSTVNNIGNPTVFVTFSNDQCYPKFHVKYR